MRERNIFREKRHLVALFVCTLMLFVPVTLSQQIVTVALAQGTIVLTPAQKAQQRANEAWPERITVPNVTTSQANDTLDLIKTERLMGDGDSAVFRVFYQEQDKGMTIYDVKLNPLENAYHIQQVRGLVTPTGSQIVNYAVPPDTSPIRPGDYVPLVPIPGFTEGNSAGGNLEQTIQMIFRWGLIIAVLLSVLMTIIGGIQYMTSDALFNKKEGKQKIYSAILGLILALSSWIILYTINPRIVMKPQSDLFGENPGTVSK